MRLDRNTGRTAAMIIIVVLGLIFSDNAFAQKRSFGGSRSTGFSSRPSGGKSFGGSRSMTPPPSSSTAPSGGGLASKGRSFGGTRQNSPAETKSGSSSGGTTAPSVGSSSSTSSFGGARSEASRQMQAKYGVPRRQIPASELPAGVPSNYIVHEYGGFSHGLMMGYLAGSSSWMWSMPFHPYFYYSRPQYIYNDDGSVEVYPPAFSFMKLLFTIVILGVVVMIVVVLIRRRRSSGGGGSQSSFG